MTRIRAVKAAAVAAALAGAVLVVAPPAVASTPFAVVNPYQVVYQDSTGALSAFGSVSGTSSSLGVTLAAGTSPSVTALPEGGIAVAVQGGNGHLWWVTVDGSGVVRSTDVGQMMAAGTSPAIAVGSDGEWLGAVWQGSNNHLWSTGPHGPFDVGVVMAAGTSPSETALPDGGFVVAVQGGNGHLWWVTVDGSGVVRSTDVGQMMAPDTSPAIAVDGGGVWEGAVWQGSNNHLWSTGPHGPFDVGVVMAAGSSPSVTPLLNGGFEAAVHGGNGDLWTSDTLTNRDTGLPMQACPPPGQACASPRISDAIMTASGVPADDYLVGYTASSGAVSLLEQHAGAGNTTGVGQGAPGASPSLAVGIPQPVASGSGTAFSLAPEVEPYALLYPDTSGALTDYESDSGVRSVGATIAAHTHAAAAPISGGYRVVWQGGNGDLWTTVGSAATDLGVAMAAGTSPSLVTNPDGTWVAAVNGADGQLHTVSSAGTNIPVGDALAPGTSPSIATLQGVELLNGRATTVTYSGIAYQGANHDLWFSGLRSTSDTGLAMAPGTSPSLAKSQNPTLTETYAIDFQGKNGDLWFDRDLPAGFAPTSADTGDAMAPGTSPSMGGAVNVNNAANSNIVAIQGSNGHLWIGGYFGVGDTGQPMMAGTDPSLIDTPIDLPGKPLGGQTWYVGYTANTGIVSLYGSGNPPLVQSTGQLVAPGTSPSLVSALNVVDGGTVVSDARPSAAGTTIPLHLPSKPTITPVTKPVVMSDTCPTVRAHLKQYSARGIKQVTCQTTTAAATPAPARTGPHTIRPHIAISSVCSSDNWSYSRTEACYQNFVGTADAINTNTGAVIGTDTYAWSQDVILATNSTQITDRGSFTLLSATGALKGLPETDTLTANCGGACSASSATQRASWTQLPTGQTGTYSFTYQDEPGTQNPDTFAIFYSVTTLTPGFAPIDSPGTWIGPTIRCDNQFPGNIGAGCVMPNVTPTLVLPVSQYGAAAVNVAIGETYLAGTPGTANTPLTRGDPANTKPNRTKICNSFNTFPLGNLLVYNDSCDEYPFASSQQSGAALGVTGSSCLDVFALPNANGSWSPIFLNPYTGTQKCLRGHVNSTLNTYVGTKALGSMYTTNRMLIGDPYTAQVVN